MPDTGFRSPSMPASYRLLLAVSLAILAHTLVLAGLPSPLKEARELTHRLVFTLTTPAAVPTPENVANPEPPKPRHSEFEIPPAEPVVTSTESASNAAPESQTVTKPQPDPPERKPESTRTRETTAESPASQAMPALKARVSEPTNTPETIKRITESPTETDPYLIKLATHLAEKLDQKRVPAISALTERVSMELELRLMPNGALTRARVIKSTGVQSIDEAAYRTALAASPYPSPEGEATDRFEVELVFTPKQP